MNKICWIVVLSSLMLVFSCKESAEHEKTVAVEKDTVVAIQKDTAVNINKDIIRDYVPNVVAFKKMPTVTTEEQISKYEVFAKLYVDYLHIVANKGYYSTIELKDNAQAFAILRDETFSLKEKMKKYASAYSAEEIARLDAADAQMNAVIEKMP